MSNAAPGPRPRGRDLGIPFEGSPGRWNAITDVPGVEVGYATIVSGDGPLVVGSGPVRTGVTMIFPRGRDGSQPCFAGWSTLNGNGEMTGTTWMEEGGYLEGPVAITNTHSVGIVRDAILAWQRRSGRTASQPWGLPVVAETYDGYLNDIDGFHVRAEHVFEAIERAASGPVVEGNVGGGTGMICHEFKGGIGSASRMLADADGGYLVGVLVQANYGRRRQLRIAGVPVGNEILDDLVWSKPVAETGSIIVVVATDAPLLPHQLKRVSLRAALGIARCGGVGGNGSGDIFTAFSVADPGAADDRVRRVGMLSNDRITPLFEATVEATEEAIVNALSAAETMIGIDGHRVVAMPIDRVQAILRRHGRLAGARPAAT